MLIEHNMLDVLICYFLLYGNGVLTSKRYSVTAQTARRLSYATLLHLAFLRLD